VKKAKLDEAVKIVYEKARKFPRAVFGVEENVFKDWLKREFDALAAKTGRPVSWKPIKHTRKSKDERIRWLAPLIERGEIRFLKSHEEFMRQLIYYGEPGMNDDGPDALAGCFEIWNAPKTLEPMVYFTDSPFRSRGP
jgi:hypothetical protein